MIGNNEINTQYHNYKVNQGDSLIFDDHIKENNNNLIIDERLKHLAETENLNFLKTLFKFKNYGNEQANIKYSKIQRKAEGNSKQNIKENSNIYSDNNPTYQNSKLFKIQLNTEKDNKTKSHIKFDKKKKFSEDNNSISSFESIGQEEEELNENTKIFNQKYLTISNKSHSNKKNSNKKIGDLKQKNIINREKNSNSNSVYKKQIFYNNKENLKKIDDLIKQTSLIQENLIFKTCPNKDNGYSDNCQKTQKDFEVLPSSLLFQRLNNQVTITVDDINKENNKKIENMKKTIIIQKRKNSLRSASREEKKKNIIILKEKKKDKPIYKGNEVYKANIYLYDEPKKQNIDVSMKNKAITNKCLPKNKLIVNINSNSKLASKSKSLSKMLPDNFNQKNNSNASTPIPKVKFINSKKFPLTLKEKSKI